jgi:hypothetical protein
VEWAARKEEKDQKGQESKRREKNDLPNELKYSLKNEMKTLCNP